MISLTHSVEHSTFPAWFIMWLLADRTWSCYKRQVTLHITLMPFKLSIAPATFQHLMQVILSSNEETLRFVIVYLDDILVCSKTFNEHLEQLQQEFEWLRKAELNLKPKNCCFLRKKWFMSAISLLIHLLIQPRHKKSTTILYQQMSLNSIKFLILHLIVSLL